ncbi:DNA helicase IV [Aliivibrio sp. S3MY1]|uniref:DNA helicase IV n=1 Tax=unclassified Aliivibrio TaxID=2645654 RepID=UPI002377D287|nr:MULTISPECIES: DNA helicase IV [unclassified Aliivibrio]MDD9196750.1 DNA helicase IV [Aliivibrio sp. S3MY1]MDD9200497.1 DNA helicase IV [Aliivibrio sp. S2MY1]
MQIKATTFAQWLVQGDYYQLELEAEQLLFTSHKFQVSVPFDKWSGKVTFQRGLVWGSLCFYNRNDQIAWRVSGLPWQECDAIINTVLNAYSDWKESKIAMLNQLKPQMLDLVESFASQRRFLKQTEALMMIENLYDLFEQTGLSIPLAEQLQPDCIAPVLNWLTKPEEQLKELNETWLEAQKVEWKEFFSECESQPLNESQQSALLLNEDHTLVLAGAGSGKTSVLVARVRYLIESGQAQADEILLLAFGRQAAQEMSGRIIEKLGFDIGQKVKVATFHQLGLDIIRHVEYQQPKLSCLVRDVKSRKEWFSHVLDSEWKNSTATNRWKTHLKKWPIAYLRGDVDLKEESHNEKLQEWLYKQICQLNALQLDKKEIIERIETHIDAARLKSELNIVWPFFKAYVRTLKHEDAIDYELMISKAKQYINDKKYDLPWSFVMVDEYQDISPQRLDLIEAICHNENAHNTKATLFAVGDDWQAIYRFAGADVSLTTGFEKRFQSTQIAQLSTTYRFNDQIGAVANRFIQENPMQLKKELVSFTKQKRKAVKVIEHSSIEKELLSLSKNARKGENVIILGRNHNHKPDNFDEWLKYYPGLNLEYKTCHASKGTEADYVFIVEMTDGQFPIKARAESLDGALLPHEEEFSYAEERRLFYVALTRAKRKAWVVYHGKPSPFVQELVDKDYPVIIE